MMAIAEVAGEKGEIEYTPHHQIIMRVPTADPESVTSRLRELGLILSPIGDVLQVKACDFCDGEKKTASRTRRSCTSGWVARKCPKS